VARLPQPGGDVGNWGEILNDYLNQSHNNDGSLKDIPQSKVTNLVQALANKANIDDIPTSYTDVGAEPEGLSVSTKAELAGMMSATGMPSFASIRNALKAERSCAVWGTGDSTLDASGSSFKMMEYLAQDVATKYPIFRVMSYTKDGSTEKWKEPNIIQAGTQGRRNVRLTTRSMRYRPPVHSDSLLNTGNIDVRVLVAPDGWGTGTTRCLATRNAKEVNGSISNELSWRFAIDPTGALQMRLSANGTDLNLSQALSSVTMQSIGAADGEFVWVRTTVEITSSPTSSRTIKFFTSPADDGFTWTQLGNSITSTSSTPIYVPVAGSFFEIGGMGWQPVGAGLQGRIAEVQIRDGVEGRMVAPGLPELWERYPDSSTTFSGSPEFRVYNTARAGTAMSYHTDATRLAKEASDFGQSVLIFCDSHNEVGASGQVGWISPYQAWVDSVQTRLPNTAVMVVKQNPHTTAWLNESAYGYSHKLRLDELERLSAKNSWDVLDVYSAFINDSRGLGVLIDTDGLHPTAAGYELMGDVLKKAAGL